MIFDGGIDAHRHLKSVFINRRSCRDSRRRIGGTVSGLGTALVFCLWIVFAHGLPMPWIALAIVIALSNTALELFSPRGTDDFTMATTNALICWAFGTLIR